jgi:hypothetical protein
MEIKGGEVSPVEVTRVIDAGKKKALAGGSHLAARKKKRKEKEERERAAKLDGLLAYWAPGLAQLGYPSLFCLILLFLFFYFYFFISLSK